MLIFHDADHDGILDSVMLPVIETSEPWAYMQAWANWLRDIIEYSGESLAERIELGKGN